MNWANAAEFFAMGGHAGFVWGSFGLSAAAIALELALLRARLRAARGETLAPGPTPS